jgi:phosphoribosylaminoimidazole-succinocarboxamide synthase
MPVTGPSTTTAILRESRVPGLKLLRRGKVRDLYDLGDRLLIVATDRLSAFDVVLPGGIPDKGRVLTQLSLFWFEFLGVEHHLVSTRVEDVPLSSERDVEALRDRVMIVEKLAIQPVECIVRGYLAGSGWNEYREQGTVCGIRLPKGLLDSSALPEPLFTPSTKAENGHDENIPFDEVVRLVGAERAEQLRRRSLDVYARAAAYARQRGIIIGDTKLEWGVRPSSGELVLADEVLTPDSSRFWPLDGYAPGRSQPAYDKQYVRDWLLASGWNKSPPGPELPQEVVRETAAKYREIYERLTGKSLR